MGKIIDSQRRRIFGIAKERGMDSDDLHAFVYQVTGVESIAILSYYQAKNVIDALKGRSGSNNSKMITGLQIRYIEDLVYQIGWSRVRMQGYIKKRLGVDAPDQDPFRFLTKKKASNMIEALKRMKGALEDGEENIQS